MKSKMNALPVVRLILTICLISYSIVSAVTVDLKTCESNGECPCAFDKKQKTVSICPGLEKVPQFTQGRGLENFSLVLSSDRITEIGSSEAPRFPLKRLVLDVPNLTKLSNYAFWNAEVPQVKIRIKNSEGNVNIEDNALTGLNKFPAESVDDCSGFLGFDSPENPRICKSFSLVVEPEHLPANGAEKNVKISSRTMKDAGFVQALEIGGLVQMKSDFLENFGKNLTHLHLYGNLLDSISAKGLNTLVNLEELKISQKFVTEPNFKLTEKNLDPWIENKPKLHTIAIEGGFDIGNANWLHSIKYPDLIEHLSLKGNNFPNGLPSGLKKLENLKTLDLSTTNLMNGGNLVNFKNDLTKLESVVLPAAKNEGSETGCDCKTIWWMKSWSVFKKQGAKMFKYEQQHDLTGAEMTKAKSITDCLDMCSSCGHFGAISWILALLVAFIAIRTE